MIPGSEEFSEIISDSFFKEYEEIEKIKAHENQEQNNIIEVKKISLQPIELFLQKFVDLELQVKTSAIGVPFYKQTGDSTEIKYFSFYQALSSKKWSPGVSLFFDYPAQVEIAVPNNVEEHGAFVVHVISHHQHSFLLEQKFTNYKQVCEAIAKFLAKNTVSIKKDIAPQMQTTKKNNQLIHTKTAIQKLHSIFHIQNYKNIIS